MKPRHLIYSWIQTLMQTIIYHPNSKEIYVNFIFENDPAKNYVQTDDQWKLTDSENGNYNSN